MRFFSRVTFICNCCFLIAVVLRWVELGKRSAGNGDAAIKFQPLEATLVILGYGAIFLNLIFVLFAVYGLLFKKIQSVPGWIVWSNLLIFPLQVYFFFFTN
ncbi:MAG: hypothetical protein JST81_12600 [Bacteroidetes bacterium]|nr:hypothetical protein [Bacteroidota bacterium]